MGLHCQSTLPSVPLIINIYKILETSFTININLGHSRFNIIIDEILFFFFFWFFDRFCFQCLNWASCNGDKCNGGATMARGAIEKCHKNKILLIFKTSLQSSQTFIAFIFPFLSQLHSFMMLHSK